MKYVIRILLFIVVGFLCYGFWVKNTQGAEGDRWIGIGVLIFSLVLLPVFLWYRYKNKKLDDFTFKFDNKNTKKTDNQ